MVTYKPSLQVPAPAVVHEPDKTSSQEVPQQDGDICYQHVRHRQPHEFLQGRTQEKGMVKVKSPISSNWLQPCKVFLTHLNLLFDVLVLGDREGVQKKDPRFWKTFILGPSSTSYQLYCFGIILEPLEADNDINLAGLLGSLVIMHANCLAHWQCPVYGSYQHYCTERGSEVSPLASPTSSEV